MLTLVPQIRHNECHIGAVLTMLSGYCENVSYKEIRKTIGGNSLADIEDCLVAHGINCNSYEFNKEKLERLDFKVMIAHVDQKISRHFIVIEKEKHDLYYYNPADYKRHILTDKIKKGLTGYCVATKMVPNSKLVVRKPQIHFKTRFFIFAFIFNALLVLLLYS